MSKSATLYVCRPVLNAQEVIAWAKEQGFKKTLDPKDLHVTVCYSKNTFVWPEPLTKELSVAGRGNLPREVKALGDKGAVVLAFESFPLYKRWREFLGQGASWDYATYQPHLTITYDGKDMDLADVKPFKGVIELGPEKFAELDEDWSDKVKEKRA